MASRPDPYRNFNFRVEIDGVQIAGFSECSGLDTEIAVIEYREGDDKAGIRKLPGLAKFGDIVLKRGIGKSNELHTWLRNIINGVPDRRNGFVVLMDADRTEVARWKFSNAWIRKLEGPKLNARGNDVAIETIELCCEDLEYESQ
jgi:phage tail-like protein